MDDKKIAESLKRLIREMHQYKNPEEIETLKKLIKRNVGLFERNSLLTYLFMKSSESFKSSSASYKNNNHNFNNVNCNNNDIVQLWCNISFFDDKSNNSFLDFIASTSLVPREDIIEIKKIKTFSFISIKAKSKDKIIRAFKDAKTFENKKVIIQNVKKQTEKNK